MHDSKSIGKNEKQNKMREELHVTKLLGLKRRAASIVWISWHDISKRGAGFSPIFVSLNGYFQSIMVGW